ncbi:MAG: TonB-dependent receptor plug domain-containing protein, partial [Janthinobacterium lividum]
MKHRLTSSVSLLAAMVGWTGAMPGARAQSAAVPNAAKSDPASEQVIVTGTRDPHQTARKSLSPIVVVTAAQLKATGQPDVRDALVALSPSITRPNVTSGNANMLDTIALRSLTSDQTLILVDGKRRHTTSVITDATGPQNGVAPVDLGLIPVSAIDHIEILEDGAAAQYGSDAIAGVVNIILKHGDHGLTAHAVNGGYYKGDGFTTGEDVSWGTKLGENGFLDLSAEFRHQDHTNRGGVDTRVGERLNQYFGSPEEQRASVEYNAGYDLGSHIQLYSFGTYAHRDAYSFQYYRTPATLPELFPAGFDPQSRIDEDDFSLTGGIKGMDFGGWDWDLSTTYGADHSNFNLFDTVNTLLYANTGFTPTSFDVMAFKNSQWTTDLGFRRAFDVPLLAGPVNFAIGAQYRNDTYSVSPGEPDSYYGSGTQGQDGLAPTSYSNSSRDVTAGYVDVATRLLPKWQIDLAGRFEH